MQALRWYDTQFEKTNDAQCYQTYQITVGVCLIILSPSLFSLRKSHFAVTGQRHEICIHSKILPFITKGYKL